MSVIPQGKKLRKAVKWISDERLEKPGAGLARLISDACVKFDLPPKDFSCVFLLKKIQTEQGTAKGVNIYIKEFICN
jgi:hypothetical protein